MPTFIEIGGVGNPANPTKTLLETAGAPSFLFSGGRRIQPRRQISQVADDQNRGSFIFGDRHMGGCNYAFVDGHVKWLKSPGDGIDAFEGGAAPNTNEGDIPESRISPNTMSSPAWVGLDYNFNGVDGKAARPNTARD